MVHTQNPSPIAAKMSDGGSSGTARRYTLDLDVSTAVRPAEHTAWYRFTRLHEELAEGSVWGGGTS
jgi:hypothetical protein